MDRPSLRESGVLNDAATRMADEIVKRWDREGSREEWVASMVKVIGREHDAYRMARRLEDDGVVPDADLVEVLGDVLHYHDAAHNDAVELWVRFMNIKPERQVGDTVSWNSGRGALTGTITGILDKLAQYVVTPPDDPKFKNGGGYMVDFEKVRDPDPITSKQDA